MTFVHPVNMYAFLTRAGLMNQISQSSGYIRIPLYHRSDADFDVDADAGAASRKFDCVRSWSSPLLGMNEAFERSVQMVR